MADYQTNRTVLHGVAQSVATYATLPTLAPNGFICYCEADHKAYIWEGTGWRTLATSQATTTTTTAAP